MCGIKQILVNTFQISLFYMGKGAQFPKFFWSHSCSFCFWQQRLELGLSGPQRPGSLRAAGPTRVMDWPASPQKTGDLGEGRRSNRLKRHPHRGHRRPELFESRPRPWPGREKRTSQPVSRAAWGRPPPRGHELHPALSGAKTKDREAGEGTRASSTAQRERRRAGEGPPAADGWGSVTHILTAAAATRKHQPGTKTRRGTGRGEDKWGKETASARTREEGRHFRGKHSSRESSSVPAHPTGPLCACVITVNPFSSPPPTIFWFAFCALPLPLRGFFQRYLGCICNG